MTNGRFTIGLMANEEMTALRARAPSIQAMAVGVRRDGRMTVDGQVRQVTAYNVSPGFFELFGLPMALGRGIEAEDAARGAPPVVVLSHTLWQRAYGGRADVVGSAVTFMDRPARIIGVAPGAFAVPARTDVWSTEFMPESIGHYFDGYLRLAPGATAAALEGPGTQAMTALGKKYPDFEVDRAYRITPLLTATVGDLGPILLILFAATTLLLVLAAVNVTNLVLSRSRGRMREIAIRTALGATRRRILVRLTAESLLLSISGGALGLAAAFVGVRILLRLGAARLPRLDAASINGTVVLFAAALAVLTGVVVGLVPALRMADGDTALLMNESGRGVRGSRRTRRLLAVLIAAELAVAVAVVAGAWRLVASYDRLQRADAGFEAPGRLVFDVMLPTPQRIPAPAAYLGEQRRLQAWWQATAAALQQAGAAHVAAATAVPLAHEWDSTTFADIVSRPGIPPEDRPNGRLRRVTPGFFQTMGMRLPAGRDFGWSDGPGAPLVTIVNEEFVRRFFGDRDPLRERLTGFNVRVVNDKPVRDDIQIVGVVANATYSALAAAPEPTVYIPMAQSAVLRASIVVTTPDGAPEQHARDFRRVLMGVEPRLAIESATLSSLVSSSLERQRLGMWLMSGFGLAALLLATVGVFAVLAYSVSQRTGEMAIRQALGATRADVYWSVVRDGCRTAAAGLATGLGLAWWTGRLIRAYVYDVAAADAAVLAVSVLSVAVVAVAAMLLPARRAASLDPARALRLE